ncbi:MAG: aminodeoxychorismate/anthranilate synthase component II [Candidatus Zixiibacteriota bacterium]
MILFIDNYDSFIYNIVQYFGERDSDVRVFRPHEIALGDVIEMRPEKIVLSPGPGHPRDAQLCLEIIESLQAEIPILGVCLGHQCIAQAYGAEVRGAERLVHGKTSEIYHRGKGILAGLPNPFRATRYHSLIVSEETLPAQLHAVAYTADGEVMGLMHDSFPLFGVQFHPESILTDCGKQIISNFLDWPS